MNSGVTVSISAIYEIKIPQKNIKELLNMSQRSNTRDAIEHIIKNKILSRKVLPKSYCIEGIIEN